MGVRVVEELSGAVEEALLRDGIFASGTKGASMKPMLRAGRDTVYITKNTELPKKYDVILYRTDSGYTLHRIVGVRGGVDLVRGDNTYRTERVPRERVLGILSGVQRGGKYYDITSLAYRLYAHLWLLLYPVRFLLFKFRSLFKK